jgi:penicillin amidase
MVERLFGQPMRQFITQTSNYQAALDNSLFPSDPPLIPVIEQSMLANRFDLEIADLEEVGSNNWAVTGAHTESGSAMLSDDMHLSFAVPIIWYRAQLNYPAADGQNVRVTGVSLPGAPAIVVGSNGKVAWGFTNAYIDTADWVAINNSEPITIEDETIRLPDSVVDYPISMSRFGPVKTYGDQQYALSWVAHQDYAVDMELMGLETASSAKQGLDLATTFGVPVQNLLLVDNQGNAGWQLAGAIPGRTNPADVAQVATEMQTPRWRQDESQLPRVYNPQNGLLWSANARVMSTSDALHFGDGGYALGARSAQIRERLQEQSSFDEADFYRIQLDNQARFYRPWRDYLIQSLMSEPRRFAKDIQYLKAWGECACSDSVGFTLVKYFRSRVIDITFSPVEAALREHELSLSVLKRYLEPAIWQLLNEQPDSWLPPEYSSWEALVIASYVSSTKNLLAKYSDSDNYQDLAWGKVNTLHIQHPFSKQMPLLSGWLDMPKVAGFGDTFMPAVQSASFGASQRFIVQPGLEERGILTVPGGQSAHPLSKYYRAGFDEYANQAATPLLPGTIQARLVLQPAN